MQVQRSKDISTMIYQPQSRIKTSKFINRRQNLIKIPENYPQNIMQLMNRSEVIPEMKMKVGSWLSIYTTIHKFNTNVSYLYLSGDVAVCEVFKPDIQRVCLK